MPGSNRSRRRVVAPAVAVAVAALMSSALGGAQHANAAQIMERDVTQTNWFLGGEPEIAVNPTNPNNLVWVSTYYKYIHYREAGQDVDLTPISQILTNGLFGSQ